MEMKIMQPITVGGITLKNRIMFPPLTTGYEERDGSIGEQSRAFYTRLAQGGVGYIVLGDVAPIRSFSPTPKLFDDSQIESFRLLADRVHAYGAKLGVQIFHPEYDCDAVNALFAQGKMEEVRARLLHHRQNMCMRAARAEGGRGRGPGTWRPFGGMSVQHTHEPSYR